MKFKLLISLVLMFSFSAIAEGTQKKETQFNMRLAAEPATFDWNIAHTTSETYILLNIMEGLVSLDHHLELKPALAEDWKKSPDGKTYTFNLRKNVKWSDGKPMTAHDFFASWKRLLSPLTASSYAYFLFDIVGAKDFFEGKNKDFSKVGIKVINDHTFEVTLNQPIAHWIYIPTFWVTFPMRQDVLDEHGTAWAKPGRMKTLGPYSIQLHDIGSKIVLRKNPYYYASRGNIDQINMHVIEDDTEAMSRYESGKLDFLTEISTLDLKRLQSRLDLKKFPYLKTAYLGFAVNRYPVNHPNVRKAIAMAIDKKAIGKILHGGQKEASSFVPPLLLGHSPAMGLDFDVEMARINLKIAGLDPTRKTKIELIIPNWSKSKTLAEFLRQQLKTHLNFDVQIKEFSHKEFRAQVDLKGFPMFDATWGADFPDPDNFLSLFSSDSGNNRTGWKNSKFDQLVSQARSLRSRSKRTSAYLEAQRILIENQAVIVPLYYEPITALVKSRVRGLFINPLNYLKLKDVTIVY